MWSPPVWERSLNFVFGTLLQGNLETKVDHTKTYTGMNFFLELNLCNCFEMPCSTNVLHACVIYVDVRNLAGNLPSV